MISQSHREYIEGFVLQTKELLLLLVLCNLTSDEKAAASLKSLLPLMLCLYSQWEKSAHDIMCSSPGDVCTNTNAWMCLCRDTCGLRSAETDPSCTWTLITTTSSHVSNSRPTGRNAARPLHSGFTKVVGSYPRGITFNGVSVWQPACKDSHCEFPHRGTYKRLQFPSYFVWPPGA